MAFYVGLDLGQAADYTALAVVEEAGSSRSPAAAGRDEQDLHLRHLERYPLRTPYTEIADNVAALMGREELVAIEEYTGWPPAAGRTRKEPELLVDATGVGVAVTDLLRERGLAFKAITITAGEKVGAADRGYTVPKKDLVAALEVPFQSGALKVAEGLPLWPALRAELLNFRRKINLKTAHDSYEHWRETDHDDLVLAAALACWGATNRPKLATVYSF
jgi:hypothetical protein